MLSKTLEEVIEEASKDTTEDDNANVMVREYLNDGLAGDAVILE